MLIVCWQEGYQGPSYDYDPPVGSDMIAPETAPVSVMEESRYRKNQRPAAWKDQDLDEDSLAYGANNVNTDYVDTPGGDYELDGRDFKYFGFYWLRLHSVFPKLTNISSTLW